MPIAALGQVAAPLIARAGVPYAPFQLVRRQDEEPAGAAATSTVSAVSAASDGIISDPAATPDASGAWQPGATDLASLSSAAAGGQIPAAILSDPAVQKAISSIALQQGYDPSVVLGSASSVLSSAESSSDPALTDSAPSSASSSSSRIKSAASSSLADESDSLSAGAKATGSRVLGDVGNSTSFGDDSKNGTDSSFAIPRINPKFGWVAVLSLGAGYLAIEAGV